MKTEADTRAEYIDPRLQESQWGHNLTAGSLILREHYFTDGRMLSGGQRGKRKFADYILSHKNQKLAIIEAKKESEAPTEGLEQVKSYATLLKIRIVYATNGKDIYRFDMETGRGDFVEGYPKPDELYQMVNGAQSDIEERAVAEPFHKVKFDPRYYQENAIMAAVRAIAAGESRVLLTLATGTGKTFIVPAVSPKLCTLVQDFQFPLQWRNEQSPTIQWTYCHQNDRPYRLGNQISLSCPARRHPSTLSCTHYADL